MLETILLQTPVVAVADSLSTAPGLVVQEEGINVLDLVIRGGFIMIPIALMSILSVYLFIERYLAIKKAGKEDPHFMKHIRDYVLTGNLDAARNLCATTNTPIARMIEKGINRIGRPLKDIEASVENVGKLEVYNLEKNIGVLATISGAAPMVGFFGTVTGMIKAFYTIASIGSNVSPGQLAGGIYEAMVTTAAGLAVGIPAYIGYNTLVSMIEKVIYKLEARSLAFVDLLQEPA